MTGSTDDWNPVSLLLLLDVRHVSSVSEEYSAAALAQLSIGDRHQAALCAPRNAHHGSRACYERRKT
eukprot:6210486-Pleurochrysis_carterae.AAC.1